MGPNFYLRSLLLLPLPLFLHAQERVSDGLMSLYTFHEGGGQFIQDVSGVGSPLLLSINDPTTVEWIPGGGINVQQTSLIQSLANANKIGEACQISNEISLEMWVVPANSTQDGPCRMMTISNGINDRNCMLGQKNSRFISRVRTTSTNANGIPNLETSSNTASPVLQHIVYTLAANGEEKMYVNNALVASGTRLGTFDNWNLNYNLLLANESSQDRPWLGEIYLAAVYSRALTASEVAQNFSAGENQAGPSLSEETCEAQACFVDGFGSNQRVLWLPNLPFPVSVDYKFDVAGGTFQVFSDGTAHLYGATWNLQNPEYGWYVDVWLTEKKNWDEWSALGRGWKGNPTIVGDLYATWDYYILDSSKENALTGLGLFEGNVLPVTHKPATYYYGFQVGIAANDQNNLPGMSCWLDYTGTINGDYYAGNCDLNMEGECTSLPVLECAVDAEVSCDLGWNPEFTGVPVVNCEEEYELSYSDAIVSTNCPMIVERTWTATGLIGNEITCTQVITVLDTISPQFTPFSSPWIDCNAWSELESHFSDNCDDNLDIAIDFNDSTWTSMDNCAPGMFRTQTQGGWGANPNGNNPGVYLENHFAAAFPDGLVIGCENHLVLTSAQAVRDFLPSGTTPSALPAGTLVNPGGTYSNVLAGQLVAATLNTAFDALDPDFGESPFSVGELSILSGPFQGWTMNELLSIANDAIGGCSTEYSFSQINEALTNFNENFDNGTINNGFLECELPFDCFQVVNFQITATDDCGNSTQVNDVVFVGDNTAPIFVPIPQSIVVECGEIPDPVVELEEDCFGWAEITDFEEIEFSGACLPTFMWTWTATDQCGNTSTFTQFVHVEDTTAPVFHNSPENLVLACDDIIPDFVPDVSDNCDNEVAIVFSETIESDGCVQTITRTWTATDQCNNSSSVVQVITLSDTLAPTASGLNPIVYTSCGEIPPADDILFMDQCGTVIIVSFNEVNEGESCDLHIHRSWVVSDWCGNTASFTQDVYSTDEEPPSVQNAPTDLILPCGSPLPTSEPFFFDNCSDVEVFYTETYNPSPGWCDGVIRSWAGMDACGNTTIISQSIAFVDNEPPVLFGIPADISVSCGSLPEIPEVLAVDNCDNSVDIGYSESIEGSDCEVIVTRTWVATDDCGNSTVSSQVITVSDILAPEFDALPEIEIDCAQFALLSIIAMDDCAPQLSMGYTDLVIGEGCNFTVERTWTATDACNNQSSFLQIIHVTDETPPVFTSVPPNQSLNCGFEPFYEEPIVFDACDSQVDIEYNQIISGDNCAIQYHRTWIATDDCGNFSTAEQLIEVTDNVPPTIFNVPPNENWSCDTYEYSPAPANVIAIDNCDPNPVLIFNETVVAGNCPNNFQLVRTWTASDNCGNVSTAEQVISISDTTPPTFETVPQDVEAECGFIPGPTSLVATDNCPGEVSISFEENYSSGGCPVIQRIWTATDACGNSASAVQYIFVIDNEPPTISGIPPSGTASCNSIPPVPDPEVSDNCDDVIDVSFSESIVGSGCEYLIIRTWIAEDDCGNSSVISQSITVQDEASPVFIDPLPEVTITCEELPTYPGPTVMDDCADFVISFFEDEMVGTGCEYTLLRTYTAQDLCGNSATFLQTIHVFDGTAPILVGVPPSEFVTCNAIPEAAAVTAYDYCGAVVSIDFSEVVDGSGCYYQIHRTWTAIDECGNDSSAEQVIYVNDTEPPVLLNVPGNLFLECGDFVPPPANVIATDNCSGATSPPEVSLFEMEEYTNCGSIITRYWTATDNCGNTSSANQVITIIDSESPVFENAPEDITTTCENIPVLVPPLVTDNCSQEVTLNYVENIIPGGCPYEILRTWTATDNCGNSTQLVQHIFVEDAESPILIGVPSDLTLECGEIPPVPIVTATDNCSTDLPVIFTELVTPGTCLTTIERTWQVADDCGNLTAAIQHILVQDSIAPEFDQELSGFWIDCDAVPPAPEVTAHDCNDFNITFEEVLRETDCISEYTITRIWLATDVCGNQSDLVQGIVVQDTIAPVMYPLPPDMTVNCNEIPPIDQVVASDSCDPDVEVSFTEEIIYLDNNDSTCVLSNAISLTGEFVVWLPYLAGFGPAYTFGEAGGTLEQNPTDGTAHLTGQIFNVDNPNLTFQIDVYLIARRNWEEWSALGRSYKDDAGFAGDEYINWFYYEMDPSSQLIGMGDFEGSVLELSHAPANFYYGFQLGLGANNINAAFGMSGWFFYEGTLAGSPVFGVGDLMTENSCCPEQQIIRHWEVSDCAGNVTSHTQNIYVSSQPEPQLLQIPDPELLNRLDVGYTSRDEFRISFFLHTGGQVTLELFDIHGNVIDRIFAGNVLKETEYTFTYPTGQLAQGAYLVRLRQERLQLAERAIVTH